LYIGTLLGITNTLGTAVSVVAPLVVGAVTNGNVRAMLYS